MRKTLCKCVVFLLSLCKNVFCGNFWHISDIDVAGGNFSDYCHEEDNNNTKLSDPELVGPAGNYHCNSPYALAMSGLKAMKWIHGNPRHGKTLKVYTI